MNILIAPDSFKESLTALEVCQAIKTGFSQIYPDAKYQLLPLADGGEGTASVLSYVLNGAWQQVKVHDPLMRPISAKYFLTDNAIAIIEIAEACGLHLLSPNERNPLITTTYGVGELIADAISKGATQLLIGLGGSATNDAGAGMLQALGARLLDKHHKPIAVGGLGLSQLCHVDTQTLNDTLASVEIQVACDVVSPLCGLTGASHIFASQKGASIDDVLKLDQALANFAAITDYVAASSTNSQRISQNCAEVDGAGAAGGLGFALMAYCQAQLKSGFDTLAEVVKLDQHLAVADIVITGEGRLDAQSAMGKVAGAVALRAKTLNPKLPVAAICGSVDYTIDTESASPFDVILPSIQHPDTLENILANAGANVTQTAYQLAAALRLGQQFNLRF